MNYEDKNKDLILKDTAKIGEALSIVRSELGLTQTMLADYLDVNLRQYQRYESGETILPLDKAVFICKKWNYSLDQIYVDIKRSDKADQFTVDIRDYVTIEDKSIILTIPDDYWKYLIKKGKIKSSELKEYERHRADKEIDANYDNGTKAVTHQFVLPLNEFKDYIFGTPLMHWDPTSTTN